MRFAGGGELLDFVDEVHGRVVSEPGGVDDFVLRRADGTAAYQLAVVVDDAAMQVTRVVRGDDLLRSTPRQIALYRALGLTAPALRARPAGARAGRRAAGQADPTGDARLAARTGGRAETVVGALAASAGLCPPGRPMPAAALVDGFSLTDLAREPAVVELP